MSLKRNLRILPMHITDTDAFLDASQTFINEFVRSFSRSFFESLRTSSKDQLQCRIGKRKEDIGKILLVFI